MSENTCPNCSFPSRPANKFCTQCGTNLADAPDTEHFLYVLTDDDNEIVIPIKIGRHTIGRNSTNDIEIDDELISSYHAVIVVKKDSTSIEDLESRNGVYINGVKIEELTKLKKGDLIKLGTTILRYDLNQATE